MLLSLYAAAVTVFTAGLAAAGATGTKQNYKRAEDTFQLYAYGKDIKGLNVYYGDGLAYLGFNVPSTVNEATNITFVQNDESWTVSPNSTDIEWTSNPFMYIDSETGSVGFTSVNGTSTTNSSTVVTEGFGFYGHNAIFSNNNTVETLFWAAPVEEGCWKLIWNTNTTLDDGSVPVAVKDKAPTVLTRRYGGGN